MVKKQLKSKKQDSSSDSSDGEYAAGDFYENPRGQRPLGRRNYQNDNYSGETILVKKPKFLPKVEQKKEKKTRKVTVEEVDSDSDHKPRHTRTYDTEVKPKVKRGPTVLGGFAKSEIYQEALRIYKENQN